MRQDLTGLTFGKRTVIAHAKGRRWLYRCVCGREKEGSDCDLKKYPTCGCERSALHKARLTTHGMRHHPAYVSWVFMRYRCTKPNNKEYPNYGGRGIRVCDEWSRSFAAFWRDMGPTWQAGLSIERINVNGDYEPSNCTWVPMYAQAKNRRPVAQWRAVPVRKNGRFTSAVRTPSREL